MTSEMFTDLLAAQQEMPALQKSAINPHFKNKYVPLEELLQTVLPILNKHNFVLLQMPCSLGAGESALEYQLLHASGERVGGTMLLMSAKDDPQGQGSAITYARRYSLMSLLGLTADVDDDAEATRIRGGQPLAPERVPNYQPKPQTNGKRVPNCPQHGTPMRYWPEEVSRGGKPIGARYKCSTPGCKDAKGYPETIWANAWEDQQSQELAGVSDVDPNDLPYE